MILGVEVRTNVTFLLYILPEHRTLCQCGRFVNIMNQSMNQSTCSILASAVNTYGG